ncbi:hypothetical protein NliqN6_5889 [Naganishia liquefaciens]|uniref:Beta-glucosidase n=1 Tax=Naganishia liquefaciens TaxID=104408 RepID=A0A8H3YIT1_9TREE|nr:hypothetical protein NliqN6_5889 [Naganishia liquefaciens]
MAIDSQLPVPHAVLPSGFIHGFATASYQIEGGHNADGRLPSVWDDLCRVPGAIKDGTSGDVAIDSYHLYEQDIDLLAAYGATHYRFSISWSRVIPLGGREDPVNEKGIEYYNRLIDGLLARGIQPCVTIFHWDLPSELEKRYGGWSCQDEVTLDYERYSKLLFDRFGDRVKLWITLNEPYCVGMFSSLGLKPNFSFEKDLYQIAHSLILSHAMAVDLYRREYKERQGGVIGVTLNSDWCEPIDESDEAKWCASRRLDQALGWYADPIYLGRYPENIVKEAGSRLPQFTAEQWRLVKGSSDFFGLNSYTTTIATGERNDLDLDGGVVTVQHDKHGKLIGNPAQCDWLKDVPWGFRKLLRYINERYLEQYPGMKLYVTEQGFCVQDEHNMSIQEACNDVQRETYYRGYLNEVVGAVQEDGIPVAGYFAWSLADNMEWLEGYIPRFGVTAVDRENGNKRYPKKSSGFLKRFFDSAVKA